MILVLQAVNDSIQISTQNLSLSNEYKYWILFGVFIVASYSLRLFLKGKKEKVYTSSENQGNQGYNRENKIQNTENGLVSDLKEEENKNCAKKNVNELLGYSKIEIEEISIEDHVPNSLDLKLDLIEYDQQNCDSKNNQPNFDNSKEIKEKLKKGAIESEAQIESIDSKGTEEDFELLKIGYEPSLNFIQGENWGFPLVIMPKSEAKIKFPRKGRRRTKGFTEDKFFKFLQNNFHGNIQVFNNQHIPSKNNNFVYEPDFVLINKDKDKNIFIDIEIDEPYEAFSRTPTHEKGTDVIRNQFFTNRGWIVIRFSEIQIHQNPLECCLKIANVIQSIDPDYEIPFHLSFQDSILLDKAWSSLQSKKWSKERYREKYLCIENFGIRPNIETKINIHQSDLDEEIESQIDDQLEDLKPLQKFEINDAEQKRKNNLKILDEKLEREINDFEIPDYEIDNGPLGKNENHRDKRLRFDPVEHRYFIDDNPDTISASQLISKFFPEFDSDYWSKKKGRERLIFNGEELSEENVSAIQKTILEEWSDKGRKAAELGTYLHEQIELYYNELPYDDQILEFEYFLNFKEEYPTMKPYRSEWRVFDEELMIAGTIDMVYEKPNGELYLFDWKRSEKVVDEYGQPILNNFQYASGELEHLSDNSYNKYCVQQNIYRHILEKCYKKKISSMNLLILHPNFKNYHIVTVPDLRDEVEYIFKCSTHYR